MDDVYLIYFLTGILAAITLIPFIGLLRKRNADLFEPIYWASAYFFLLFVIRPICDITLGSHILGDFPFDEKTQFAFIKALFLSIPCFAVFMVGYYSHFGKAAAKVLPPIPRTWSEKKFHFFWPVIVATGLLSYYLLIRFHGGVEYFVSPKRGTLTRAGQGYLRLGVSLILFTFALSATRTIATGKGKVLTFAILLTIILTIGFFSGKKREFLLPILILLVVWHYLKSRIRLRGLVLFTVCVFLTFPIFKAYRRQSLLNLPEAVPAIIQSRPIIKSLISRFYGIDSLTIIIRDTPEVMDYQYGATFAPLAVVWIPRQIWPKKPVVTFGKTFAQTYFRELFGGTGISASSTILGEAYLNFHVAGMLWISLLCGLFIRAVYEYLIHLNFGPPAIFVYSCVFLFLFTFWGSAIPGIISAKFGLHFLSAIVLVILIGKRKHISNLKTVHRTLCEEF